MAGIPAIGTGPVALTDPNGSHKTIPLSALTFDSGTIKLGAWKPYDDSKDNDFKTNVTNWLAYLVGLQLIKADTTTQAPAGPAFLVEAAHAGATGNDIQLDIKDVVPQIPPTATTFSLTVTATDTYTGLDLATLADRIGTSAGGGSQPGLVFVAATVPPSGNMPASATAVSFAGSPPRASIPDGTDPTKTAFTLEALGDGGGGTFNVDVTPATDTFDLTVHWSKSLTAKTIADHITAFQYIVTISSPPGGYGVPHDATIMLAGGANAGTPTTAKASVS